MRDTDLHDHIKEAAKLLANELEIANKKINNLEKALTEIFPIDLYKELRPDVNKYYEGEDKKILEHFVKTGISEINLKDKINANENKLALRLSENCIRDVDIMNNIQPKSSIDKAKRELLKTRGNKERLNNNKNHTFALEQTLVHYQSNTVCTWIPKNGCSNLRYSIAKSNGAIASIKEIDWIHKNISSFCASTKEALMAEYNFVFLRNPFKRILSFYTDKICNKTEDASADISYQQAQALFKTGSDTSFNEFVDLIWKNPELIYMDIHTKPQTCFLLYREYDDYFCIENYQDAKEKILQKTGLEIVDTREYNSIFTTKTLTPSPEIGNTTSAKKISEFMRQGFKPIANNMYTKDMIKKISTLYLGDIMLYCKRIENHENELEPFLSQSL